MPVRLVGAVGLRSVSAALEDFWGSCRPVEGVLFSDSSSLFYFDVFKFLIAMYSASPASLTSFFPQATTTGHPDEKSSLLYPKKNCSYA